MTETRRYRVKEFALLAGVTVRTLHHYDRLGILTAKRDASGFRIYTAADLERLESIIALRFIGLPLMQVRAALSGAGQDLGRALRCQLSALEEKKRRIELTIETIREAEAALRSGETPCLKHIIEVIGMQEKNGWILEHFREDTRARAQDRLASLTPSRLAELQSRWSTLAGEIHAKFDDDPAGADAQALLSLWEALVREITASDQELVHGLKSLYADRNNWPERVRNAITPLPDERVLEFLRRAAAARAG